MDVLIIEDEKHIARQICEHIEKYDPSIRIVGILSTVKQSVDWLRMNTADLIFMDIHLYDGLCFDIFEKVSIQTPVVFSTPYNDFTIQAFENNGVAYISKPISYDNIVQALRKIFRLSRSLSIINEHVLVKELNGMKRKRFMVAIGNKIISIPIKDVAYFFANDKVTYLVDMAGQRYTLEYSLEYLESIAIDSDFFRINRKHLVSYQSIFKMHIYGANRIKLELKVPYMEEEIVVSVERTPKFKLWLDGYVVD
jgi:two-component system response regulator LytT